MLGGFVGRGHHVGAEHGAPRGLPLHALQQSLLPQVAEQALKDVDLQFTQRRHQHLVKHKRQACESSAQVVGTRTCCATLGDVKL